jgi:hypothetical protein
VLQREADIIEAFEQAVAGEFVDLEAGGESAVVLDFALFQVERELVVG